MPIFYAHRGAKAAAASTVDRSAVHASDVKRGSNTSIA